MAVSAKQIYTLLIAVLAIQSELNLSCGHDCHHSGSCTSPAHEAHGHHHCDHAHDHHHHHHHGDDGHVFGEERRKLPEELAEEEDLKLFGFGGTHHGHNHVHDHDHEHNHSHGVSELSGVGLWIYAMGCSLLVSLASLICLILLPLIFIQGKPSKTFVDSLALFGAGAMLGDAFLHQLPHAFGGEHAHLHDHHMDDAHQHIASRHGHSHSHSLKDLSIGLSVLVGIVLFLLVEKVVRYVEHMSGGVNAWNHGHHHHHHHKKSELNDLNDRPDNIQRLSQIDKDESISEMPIEEKLQGLSDDSLNGRKKSESSVLRKRQPSTSAGENNPDLGTEHGPTNNIKSMLEKEPVQSSSSLVFGYLNLFSDGVHNFTDGMALGSAFLLHGSIGGWSRTLFLLAHELPQEVGDFGILVRSGFSVSKALFFNFLSALVALAGTALALLLGQDPGHSSLVEGFTAGGFIYIAVAGVLAEMNNGSSALKSTAIQLTSLILGMGVALFISLVE